MTQLAPPETGPRSYFTTDHRRCDDEWAAVEAAAEAGAAAVASAFAAFESHTRRHFDLEENLLFPAVEAVMPHAAGPTGMMRAEHRQMRGVLDRMRSAADGGRIDELLDLGDTLLMVVQQHNMKEEGILYPMCEQSLRDTWASLVPRLPRD